MSTVPRCGALHLRCGGGACRSSSRSRLRSAIGLDLLFIIDGLGTGGAERSLAELLDPLVERGHRPVVARFHDRSPGVEAAVRAAGHEVVAVPGRNAASRARVLRRLTAERRPQLVHSTLFSAGLATRLAVLGSDVPLLTSLVNTTYDTTRRVGGGADWRSSLVRQVDRVSMRRVDHVHAISDAVAADAIAHLGVPAERITVVPRGRDTARLGAPSPERRARVRASLGIDADAPVVLTVGREERQKGHVHLVAAIPALRRRHPDVVVLLAGRPGAASARITEAAGAAGVGGSLRRLGHRDDIGDLLAAADVFAFPSLWEGLGGAVLEAMAMRRPVVASDLPVLHETLDPAGCAVFAPPADPVRLADAIADLLDDEAQRVRMGEAAGDRFEAVYRSELVTARMIQLIEDVAARGR